MWRHLHLLYISVAERKEREEGEELYNCTAFVCNINVCSQICTKP